MEKPWLGVDQSSRRTRRRIVSSAWECGGAPDEGLNGLDGVVFEVGREEGARTGGVAFGGVNG